MNPQIVNLRLVGLGLKEVPGAVGKHLWSLKSLSLSSNALEKIPDGLCDLTALTELNLVRNKLGALPDRFEEICCSGKSVFCCAENLNDSYKSR